MKRFLFTLKQLLHKENLKKPIKLTPLVFLLALLSIIIIKDRKHARFNEIQESIASELLRFHVIANSDSKEDQSLKLVVKDEITQKLKPLLEDVNSLEEARLVLSDNLVFMEDLANEVIRSNGYKYTAKASIESSYFPLKVYGDLALPPGEYEALRIQLGKAEGKNWWCIMFPPLCFVDSTYTLVPDESKEQLQYVLTQEEYDEILIDKETKDEEDGDIPIKVKFKIFTFLNDLFQLEE